MATYYVNTLKTQYIPGWENQIREYEKHLAAGKYTYSGKPLTDAEKDKYRRNIAFNKKRIAKAKYIIARAGSNDKVEVPAAVSADIRRGGVK